MRPIVWHSNREKIRSMKRVMSSIHIYYIALQDGGPSCYLGHLLLLLPPLHPDAPRAKNLAHTLILASSICWCLSHHGKMPICSNIVSQTLSMAVGTFWDMFFGPPGSPVSDNQKLTSPSCRAWSITYKYIVHKSKLALYFRILSREHKEIGGVLPSNPNPYPNPKRVFLE